MSQIGENSNSLIEPVLGREHGAVVISMPMARPSGPTIFDARKTIPLGSSQARTVQQRVWEHGQPSDVTYSDVIVRVESLEDFRRAVAARYVHDLVCSESPSLRQFLALGFQPNLRLAMIDLLSLERSAFLHGTSLP